MKIAYLDTIGGIAGDMTLAAFVGAGLRLDDLSSELSKLPLSGFEILGKHVTRSGIDAVQIEVVVSHEAPHRRGIREIMSVIDTSRLSQATKTKSKAAFEILAAAEARIHHTTSEKVHFHEVGATDAIVDIVGTAICLERFGIDAVYTSPIKIGSGGIVQSEHGAIPVPSPATLEILKGYPIVLTKLTHEMTTPTGAAIIRAFSSGVMTEDQIVPHSVGYGAGTLEVPGIPNLLRVIIGDLPQPTETEELHLVETNIDDMNPQVYPYLLEKLLASGANDAYLTPVIMKKGRPGILLSVMTSGEKIGAVIDLLYANTSTIGLRIQKVRREKLHRREILVTTSLGTVRAKAVVRNGKESVSAEFEECKRIAEERGIPLPEVLRVLGSELS
jgi:hypothetical protein